MTRLLIAAIAATAVASACLASAATLGGGTSSRLSGVDGPVPHCDADGFAITYSTSGGSLTSVSVGGIADPGCEGGELSLAVVDGAGDRIAGGGPQTVPTDGDVADNTVQVSVSPQAPAEEPAGIHVAVVGP